MKYEENTRKKEEIIMLHCVETPVYLMAGPRLQIKKFGLLLILQLQLWLAKIDS
jgi:hypothetical protein